LLTRFFGLGLFGEDGAFSFGEFNETFEIENALAGKAAV
jgi:hypothetical protein